MSEHPEFSVYQFFPDETWERVLHFVTAEEAVSKAKVLTQTVGAKIGTTRRVIITDGDDFCCFEWKFGEGVTFPTKEHIEAAKKEGES